MFRAHSNWRNSGAKFLQIEPRLSNTAARSDKWIAINPGTEGALALGLCHVFIKESLYDQQFVTAYASGFDAWKEAVLKSYSPEQVEKITGVEKSIVISLATDFAKAKKPVALWGRGQARTGGSAPEAAAVIALNALAGNINRPGGVWAVPSPDYIDWPMVPMDKKATTGMGKGRIGQPGAGPYPFSGSPAAGLIGAINQDQGHPVEALLVAEANPVYTLPGSAAVAAAFDKIPFVVSFSSYMDETARQADLILPNHIYLERYEDLPAPAGFQKPVIGLSQPVVAPLHNTRHIGDVILALSKKLGGTIAEAFPWDDYETCLAQTLPDQWDALTTQGYWADESYTPPPSIRGFNTPSGRFEFSNAAANPAADYAPLPVDGPDRPLVLIPRDGMRLASGFVSNTPFMTKTVSNTVLQGNDIFVEINPEDAKKFSLSEGDKAQLQTPAGKARVRVHLFDGIKPGVISIPRGLGHTADDKFLAGKGVNANLLIGPVEDPATGAYFAWGTGAKLA
jgi:anaerobic selenocysteine-containing dehydrogenase